MTHPLSELVTYRDGKLYSAVKRHRVEIGQELGFHCSEGYLRFKYKGKVYKNHRVVWELHNGEIPEDLTIDHINGVRDDNRIENLRLATKRQNSLNNAASCYNWYPNYNKWVVRVTVDGKRINCGYYEDEELAALVAQEAKEKYYGEFYRKT